MATSPAAEPLTRDGIVAAARTWIGTPYHHQASLKDVGCDCLGLLRGVWREVMGEEPEAPPNYSWDWAEATGEETLRDAAARHLEPVELTAWRAGDVLLFRMSRTAPAKHCAIVSEEWLPRMVHAWTGYAVAEVDMIAYWRRRIAYAFRFPGV